MTNDLQVVSSFSIPIISILLLLSRFFLLLIILYPVIHDGQVVGPGPSNSSHMTGDNRNHTPIVVIRKHTRTPSGKG